MYVYMYMYIRMCVVFCIGTFSFGVNRAPYILLADACLQYINCG